MLSRIIVTCLLVTLAASPGQAETLTLAIGEWKPYAVFNSNGEARGIAVDKAHRVFANIGVKLAIARMPFKRALVLAKTGVVDGLLLSADKPTRRSYLALSYPIFCDRRFLYVRKGRAFNWQDSNELQGKMLGVGIGFYNGQTIHEWITGGTVKTSEVSDTLSLFRMLVHDRVDIITFSEKEAIDLLNENPRIASEVMRLEPPVDKTELHLGFTLSRRGQYRSVLSNTAIEQLSLEERCE